MIEEKSISLNDVICGHYRDNKGWHRMQDKTRRRFLIKIKDFLLSGCHYNSGVYRAINRMDLSNLPGSYGIFNRVMINQYIAGQDYPGELRFVKNLIKREC